MNGKNVCLATLAFVLLPLGIVRGQTPPPLFGGQASPAVTQTTGYILVQGEGTNGTNGESTEGGAHYGGKYSASGGYAAPHPIPQPSPTPNAGLSRWITSYSCPDCCGGANDGPIQYELYFRSGPSFPIGGAIFGHVLEPGWMVDGGGRSLFFNKERDRAWAVNIGIGSIWNHGQLPERLIPLRGVPVIRDRDPANFNDQVDSVRVPLVLVNIRTVNRTFLSLGGGHEWYLCGTAQDDGPRWRAGVDAGGRWGSINVETRILTAARRIGPVGPFTNHDFLRINDVIGSCYLAAHTDYEVPCGFCIWQTGLRLEWSYTWSDVLQRQNNSDIQDLNLLITAGVRY